MHCSKDPRRQIQLLACKHSILGDPHWNLGISDFCPRDTSSHHPRIPRGRLLPKPGPSRANGDALMALSKASSLLPCPAVPAPSSPGTACTAQILAHHRTERSHLLGTPALQQSHQHVPVPTSVEKQTSSEFVAAAQPANKETSLDCSPEMLLSSGELTTPAKLKQTQTYREGFY